MVSMSFRFLGNKSSLLPQITEAIASAVPPNNYPQIIDLFSGTASVSVALGQMGYRVVANDLLLSCVVHAQAQLLPDPPLRFEDVLKYEDLPTSSSLNLFSDDSTYSRVIAFLNALPGKEGFFFKEYSPDGCPSNGADPRKYFASANACKIDAIRSRIRRWGDGDLVSPVEHAVLLHNLMLAVNQVANTAGTYGYFFSSLSQAAQQPLKLRPTSFQAGAASHRVLHSDAKEAVSSTSADVAYLDPPYNKRQYAAYYHILETIAYEDNPDLIGKSGLRPWQENASDFCYKSRASVAMADLLNAVDARYIFVSYSEDGHISHDKMMTLLARRGKVTLIEMDHARYSSQQNENPSLLKERIYKVKSV